jgi:NTE family protein
MNFNLFKKKNEIGLVLGSGGARGLAHVGVMECLTEQDYRIKEIAGCSIGSLIGAIYLSGNLTEFKKWISNLDFGDVFDLIDFTFNAQGFIKGEKVFKKLKSFISDVNIEDLDIPFRIVATDLKNKKEVVFEKGSLYNALRSSIAIPTVLTPKEIEGVSYIDGGIVNPLPVNRINKNNVGIIVAVNLNGNKTYVPAKNFKSPEKEPQTEYEMQIEKIKAHVLDFFTKQKEDKSELGFFNLLNDSFNLTQDTLSDFIIEKYPPDVLIELSREACGTMEFYCAEEMIAAGRAEAEKVLKNYS